MLTKQEATQIKESARAYALAENIAGQHNSCDLESNDRVRKLCLDFHALIDQLTDK